MDTETLDVQEMAELAWAGMPQIWLLGGEDDWFVVTRVHQEAEPLFMRPEEAIAFANELISRANSALKGEDQGKPVDPPSGYEVVVFPDEGFCIDGRLDVVTAEWPSENQS